MKEGNRKTVDIRVQRSRSEVTKYLALPNKTQSRVTSRCFWPTSGPEHLPRISGVAQTLSQIWSILGLLPPLIFKWADCIPMMATSWKVVSSFSYLPPWESAKCKKSLEEEGQKSGSVKIRLIGRCHCQHHTTVLLSPKTNPESGWLHILCLGKTLSSCLISKIQQESPQNVILWYCLQYKDPLL